MRILLFLGFAILLSGCASSTNYYQQTVHSWQGAHVNTLVKRWGRPDDRIISANRNVVLVYYTKSYKTYNGPSSPVVGVNLQRTGRPSIVMPNTNHTWNRGPTSLTCSALFEVNKKGLIINTNIIGSGCYGSENFAESLRNPVEKPRFVN